MILAAPSVAYSLYCSGMNLRGPANLLHVRAVHAAACILHWFSAVSPLKTDLAVMLSDGAGLFLSLKI